MRTFVALDLPSELKHAIAQRQHELRTQLAEQALDSHLRWTDASKLHLTLRFLGDTAKHQQQALQAGLHTAARTIEPFALHVQGLGVFPQWRRMSVLWLAVGGDLSALQALQTQTEQIAQSCGFAPETRPYRPHLTLARVNRSTPAPVLRQLEAELRPLATAASAVLGSWKVTEMVWMQSQLHPSGAQYTRLAEFPLGRPASSE